MLDRIFQYIFVCICSFGISRIKVLEFLNSNSNVIDISFNEKIKEKQQT